MLIDLVVTELFPNPGVCWVGKTTCIWVCSRSGTSGIKHLHNTHPLSTSYTQLMKRVRLAQRAGGARTRKCWWNLRFPSCQSPCPNSLPLLLAPPLPSPLPPSYFSRPLAHARHLTLFATCAWLPNNMIKGSGGKKSEVFIIQTKSRPSVVGRCLEGRFGEPSHAARLGS